MKTNQSTSVFFSGSMNKNWSLFGLFSSNISPSADRLVTDYAQRKTDYLGSLPICMCHFEWGLEGPEPSIKQEARRKGSVSSNISSQMVHFQEWFSGYGRDGCSHTLWKFEEIKLSATRSDGQIEAWTALAV
jgi:hypothetical protein